MSIADELKKLEDLRRNGTLTETEFAQAKATVLAQPAPTAAEPAGAKLDEHLAQVRYQNELERIDREWAMEREKYMITGKNGQRHVPTVGDGLGAAVIIGVFGVFWTILAFTVTNGGPDFGPDFGPPPVIRIFFPLFGVAFTAFGIWSGITAAQKAEAYTRAHAAYQRRRAAVKPDDFR